MKTNSLVHGVGINDAWYAVTCKRPNGKGRMRCCPYYAKWEGMLSRCYSANTQERQPTYIGCTVCAEWLYFSKFRAWMEIQNWEGRHLDKDLRVKGNKVYSPDTCIFVSPRVNTLFTDKAAARGEYSLGVSYVISDKRFKAQIQNGTGEQVYLGYFKTEEAAHRAWQAAKLELIKLAILDSECELIKSALQMRYVELSEDIKHGRTTIKLQ